MSSLFECAPHGWNVEDISNAASMEEVGGKDHTVDSFHCCNKHGVKVLARKKKCVVLRSTLLSMH